MRSQLCAILLAAGILGIFSRPSPAQEVAGSNPSLKPASPASPPPLPPAKSPVDSFRELLAMKPAEREQALASKSESQKKVIQDRLNDFEALTLEQREARLQRMKLRWQLLPLLRTALDQRAPLLAAIPEADRKLIDERLQHWDKLPTDLQKEVLDNELMLGTIVPGIAARPGQPNIQTPALSSATKQKMEENLKRWQQLPPDRQQKMYEQFRRLFDLNENSKNLEALSQVERKEMEKSLQDFKNLPRSLQDQCVKSLRTFAGMSLDERVQFLKSAERWQKMSSAERQAWRDLVSKMPPMPPLLPPLPGKASAQATNR